MIIFSLMASAQEQKSEETTSTSILDLDESWGKEIFLFPIPFAPSINYTGIAEVRFPPSGWRIPEHPFFWSYTYVWSVDSEAEITTSRIEQDLENYFDGLNDVRENHNLDRKAESTLVHSKRDTNEVFLSGTVSTYDRFATNALIILNVKVKIHSCDKRKGKTILFTFSPQDFESEIWETLDDIKFLESYCN